MTEAPAVSVDPPAETAAAPVETTTPPPQQPAAVVDRSISTSSAPDLSSLKEITDAALAAKQKNVEYAKQLADTAMLVQEREAAVAQMRAELDAAKQENERHAARERAEKEKKRAHLETLLKTLTQNQKKMNMPDDVIGDQVEGYRAAFDQNPDLGLKNLETNIRMAVLANSNNEEQKRKSELDFVKRTEEFNKSWIDAKSRKWTDFSAQELGFQQAAQSTLASTSKFMTPVAASSPAAPPAETAATATPIPAVAAETPAPTQPVVTQPTPQQQTRKRPFVEKPAAQLFTTVKASEDQFPCDVAELVSEYVKATGKIPSMRDVQLGTHFVATGRMQASADGYGEEPVYDQKRLRRTPARIEPANFAPDFDRACMEQMSALQHQPRFQKARWAMTQEGNIYGAP
jgi:hypothetical protein